MVDVCLHVLSLSQTHVTRWAAIARSWWKQSLKPMQVPRETAGVEVDQVFIQSLKQHHNKNPESELWSRCPLTFMLPQVVSVLPWSQPWGRSRAYDIGMDLEVDRKFGRSKATCYFNLFYGFIDRQIWSNLYRFISIHLLVVVRWRCPAWNHTCFAIWDRSLAAKTQQTDQPRWVPKG